MRSLGSCVDACGGGELGGWGGCLLGIRGGGFCWATAELALGIFISGFYASPNEMSTEGVHTLPSLFPAMPRMILEERQRSAPADGSKTSGIA